MITASVLKELKLFCRTSANSCFRKFNPKKIWLVFIKYQLLAFLLCNFAPGNKYLRLFKIKTAKYIQKAMIVSMYLTLYYYLSFNITSLNVINFSIIY